MDRWFYFGDRLRYLVRMQLAIDPEINGVSHPNKKMGVSIGVSGTQFTANS
jgi:hypothetical protein